MSDMPTEETFLKDVAKHEMAVLVDNGVYRHLRLKQPGSSNMWFDIVTWPGFLAYSGDMGSFVFSRLNDMFQFFRNGRATIDGKEELYINLSYWGEKLEAVDRNGRESGHRVYSADRLRAHVEDSVKTWIEEYEGQYDDSEEETASAKTKFEAELREAIEEDIYRYLDDGEHDARTAVRDFSFKQEPKRFDRTPPTYEFQDTWEWDCDEYTFRFIWCCYALAWSIRRYDAKATEASAEHHESPAVTCAHAEAK
jgi:hypothetical protein